MAYRQIETDKERNNVDTAQLQKEALQSQRNDLVNLPVDSTKKDALLKVFDTMSSKSKCQKMSCNSPQDLYHSW